MTEETHSLNLQKLKSVEEKKKRQSEYENVNESLQSSEDRFRINVFCTILDSSVAS